MNPNMKTINNEKLIIEHAPFMHDNIGISKIMAEVIISLMPAVVVAAYYFGIDALNVMAVSVLSCILSEYLWQKFLKINVRINDLSAVVTGILLALTLPPKTPLWIVCLGSIFSIVLVKQVFGGLGHNIFNPALAGRAFIQVSWPHDISNWQMPATISDKASTFVINNQAGNIGEISLIALFIAGIFLVLRKHIFAVIPIFYITTVAIGAFACGENILFHALSGGLFLGAIFMATDPVTSPLSGRGKLVFAFFCGILTLFLRVKGGLAESVYFSILIMNMATPLIDKYTLSKPYGVGNI
jgi:electron transport complex protein RnfD